MKRLFEGAKRFNRRSFEKNTIVFDNLNNSHNPHTLFITCCDSKVIPSLITDSHPGELFVIRNVANIVPPYNKSDVNLSTTSSIEYAIKVLDVNNIVVCGHSNCGACKALVNEEKSLADLPYTKEWVELARPAKDKVFMLEPSLEEKDAAKLIEKENILLQMEHLMTYKCVIERVGTGALNIFGWYYDIATSKIYNYSKISGRFEEIR